MYEIQENVEKPEVNRGRPRVYPFAEMNVGDSFLAEGDSTSGCKAYLAAKSFERERELKFEGRKEEGGVRIFRVE